MENIDQEINGKQKMLIALRGKLFRNNNDINFNPVLEIWKILTPFNKFI